MSRFLRLVLTMVVAVGTLVGLPGAPAQAAPVVGSLAGQPLNHPIVGSAATPSGLGLWAVASDGGVFSFGDAGFHGSTGAMRLNQPIVGMAATASGAGYWLVARDGGIFSFGDAGFHGSTGAMQLNQPIVGMAATPSGAGYWLVARDGGIFSFGDAGFHGSTGAIHLNQPIVGMAATTSGGGYWFVAGDGGLFSFGDAAFLGSGVGRAGAAFVGVVASRASGYWLVATDGTVLAHEDGGAATAGREPTRKQGGLTHPSWWHDHYATAASDRMLGEIRATGADWVVIVPTWYQSNRTTSVIGPDRYRSASDDSVRRAILSAHARGLKVFLKPHIDLQADDDWRGNIRPTDLDAWFASYQRFANHFAELGGALGVEQIAVGTELVGVSRHTERWRQVIAEVRGRFGGSLTYAANFDEYPQIQFWDALDLVGVDAYFELASVPTSDVDALLAAWRPVAAELEAHAQRWQRPILFTEAGYTSQAGTATAPWNWLISSVPSPGEQAAGYEALFRTFWNEPWFAGVHWWMWDNFEGEHLDERLDYSPHGKPAENVLRAWFA